MAQLMNHESECRVCSPSHTLAHMRTYNTYAHAHTRAHTYAYAHAHTQVDAAVKKGLSGPYKEQDNTSAIVVYLALLL